MADLLYARTKAARFWLVSAGLFLTAPCVHLLGNELSTVDFLATVPLFSGLDRETLSEFAAITREKAYPKGSVILFEDDPGDSLFVVRQGRVKVVLVGEDGREVILGVLGVGEHFGELSLIDEQPRSAHVIAMEDAQMLVLRREDFKARVERSPAGASREE